MISDLPGSQIDLPDDHPDGGKLTADSPPESGTPPPASAAEEEKILDEGETQPPKYPR